METKTIFREYFPGYMGHIPMKNEVIGMTVGATNDYIKSYLTREPVFEEKLVPSTKADYTYYNKNYFSNNMAKGYNLEEDKVFSNRSKEARTWISGSKYKIYPQHIPGYEAHIPGIKSSNIFGMNYAKSTSIAIKEDYCKGSDLPSQERYRSMNKIFLDKPKFRSEEEEKHLEATKKDAELSKTMTNMTTGSLDMGATAQGASGCEAELCSTFQKALNIDNKPVTELPYIVGYKGFRRGVRSNNDYGKNFRETSLNATNRVLNKNQ